MLELNRKTVRALMGVVVVGVGAAWVLFRPADFFYVLEVGLTLLRPFIIGLSVAFVVNLLLRPVERAWYWLAGRRSPWLAKAQRSVGIVLSMMVIAAALGIMLFIVLPEVIGTVLLVVDELPRYSAQINTWYWQLADNVEAYGIAVPTMELDVGQLISTITTWLTVKGPMLLGRALGFTTSFFTGVFNVVIGFVFALYVLADKERLGRQFKQTLFAFLPEEKAREVVEIAALSNATFSKFVTGQLTDAFIVGLLCYAGMVVLSLPYAGAVSVLVGVTTIIPIIGVLLGTAVGALLILVVDPVKALWFIIFIVVLQQIESNVIYPRVVGKSVGLPGLWVFATIIIGGGAFGVLGMLVGVPICSVMYAVTRRVVDRRLASKKSGGVIP